MTDDVSAITAALTADEGIGLLVDMMAVAQRFRFFILACDTPRVAHAAIVHVVERIAVERGASVSLHSLDPYTAPDVGLDDALAPDTLHDAVFDVLLHRPVEASAEILIIDASRALAPDDRAWNLLFQRMNEQRNRIGRALPGSLVLCVPPRLEVLFARAAPDFWSIRSLAIRVAITPPHPPRVSFLRELLRTTAFSGSEALLVFMNLASSVKSDDGTLNAIADNLKAIEALIRGNLRVALGRAEGCRKLVRVLAESDPWLDPNSSRALAWTQGLLGDIERATATIDESVELMRLDAVASPRPENLGRLASCLLDRAQIVSLYDRRPTARIDVEEAIRVVRAAVDMAAGDDDPNLRLAEYVETSGDIDFQVGDQFSAGAAYREALTLRKELLSRYPAERSFDCLVAQCLLRAGLAAWAADGADAAMSACTEAVGRLRTLALDGWGAAIYKHVLALHLGNLGDLHRDRGDPARAARVYQESLQLCVELQKKEPENAYWQDTLAMSWARWARYCEQEEGSLTDALAAWQNARELLEGLLRVAPARRDWEQLLSESTAEVGRLSAHPRGDPV